MHTSRRLILSPLLLAVVALTSVIGVATSSTAAGPGPDTRVRANATATAEAVGQQSGETAGDVGCLRPAQPDFESAPCVATNPGGGLVEGPNGAMRDPATGRFAANPNRVAPEPGSSVHGNARLSQQETSLYQLYDLEGNYLKTGITSNPGGRYSQDFMSDKYMNVINVGSRSNMLDLERMIVEIDPGPLNFEPWAGVGR